MKTLLLFEIKQTIRHWITYLTSFVLIAAGTFCGKTFNLTVGEGIFLNSPYTIGFMIGMLSLSILFFAILFSNQILFKVWDTKFDTIFFTLPFSKFEYLSSNFLHLFLKTFICFALLISGFTLGQNLRIGSEIQVYFNLWYYLYPLFIFGFLNCLFICSFLTLITYTTKKKLLVVVGGLLLYTLYMVVLVFSNAPFMSSSLPQSIETQQLSALLDPFGISSYFFEARTSSFQEKNNFIVPFRNMLFINRLVFILISSIFLTLSYQFFSFSAISRNTTLKKKNKSTSLHISSKTTLFPTLHFSNMMNIRSTLSFTKIDLLYLFKSIPIIAISILILFYIGMEMYAEIEKGIRLPQKYASSGLMATTISSNFHLLGLLIVTYFINNLYWRGHISNFLQIEKSTFFSSCKLNGHLISISILLLFFSILLIVQGLAFQMVFNYFFIDWKAYFGIILFNTFPLVLFSALLLLINDIVKNRFIALGISIVSLFTLASPLSKKIISYPLFRIFSGYKGVYSDFNGYGIYAFAFAERLIFGLAILSSLWLINTYFTTKKWNVQKSTFVLLILICGIYMGSNFILKYTPTNKEIAVAKAVNYEKKFRKYSNIAQPTITDVTTEISLFPSKNMYQIQGEYVIENKTKRPIDKILINFHPNLKVKHAILNSNDTLIIENNSTEIQLKTSLLSNEKMDLNFVLLYQWYAVNGHQSFNAIVKNGSFMRISRYYPTIGYQKEFEIEDIQKRTEYQLGKATGLKKLETPPVLKSDFINLNMTISTENTQTAIGTGDLVKKWTSKNRNYFTYKTKKIPFRFAVSSAVYEQTKINHKGIDITVFYSKNHSENVNHLIQNAQITLDYCIKNFGVYPFKSINFIEISSFTQGFAATAYPSAIFMTEDMVFHSNIKKDKKQDVINELAGHELAHMWWGNSQINPDNREGAPMLTETLAMYVEMMLYKKMYGKDKMMERLGIHKQIVDNMKGLSESNPLYKVTSNTPHIAYSKGAMVMVKLSESIGEKNVNKALQNFLINNKYPKKPTSLDLLNEFYKINSSDTIQNQIDKLFKTI